MEPRLISGVLDVWFWRCLRVSSPGRDMRLSKHCSLYAFPLLTTHGSPCASRRREMYVVKLMRRFFLVFYYLFYLSLLRRRNRSGAVAHIRQSQKQYQRKANGSWPDALLRMQTRDPQHPSFFRIPLRSLHRISTSQIISRARSRTDEDRSKLSFEFS